MGKNSNVCTFRSLLQALPSIWTLMLGNTMDFRGSSAQPAAPLAKALMVVYQSCFSTVSFTFHCLVSPVHLLFLLPFLQCPLLTHAAPKAVCEKPLRRDALQTATCERCLRNKCYAHIINSGSHNNFHSRLTTRFLFSWAHPSSSCKKLQDVKSFCIILSVSGKDMMELSSLPNL